MNMKKTSSAVSRIRFSQIGTSRRNTNSFARSYRGFSISVSQNSCPKSHRPALTLVNPSRRITTRAPGPALAPKFGVNGSFWRAPLSAPRHARRSNIALKSSLSSPLESLQSHRQVWIPPRVIGKVLRGATQQVKQTFQDKAELPDDMKEKMDQLGQSRRAELERKANLERMEREYEENQRRLSQAANVAGQEQVDLEALKKEKSQSVQDRLSKLKGAQAATAAQQPAGEEDPAAKKERLTKLLEEKRKQLNSMKGK